MSHSEELQELLSVFHSREEEYAYTASILVGEKSAHKIVSAWSTMPILWEKPQDEQPKDDRLLWDWLWKGTKINWTDFAARSGMDISRLQKLFEPLRANRLLYPDGSIPRHASSVLKAEVLKTLPKPTSGRK